MLTVIGTDEAGYGPNLGALCVSGTRWLIDRNDSETVLDELRNDLDPLCQKKGIFPVLDSKKLYTSKNKTFSINTKNETFENNCANLKKSLYESLVPLEKTVLLSLFLMDGKFPDGLTCKKFFDRFDREFENAPNELSETSQRSVARPKITKDRQSTIFDLPGLQEDELSESDLLGKSNCCWRTNALEGSKQYSASIPFWERKEDFSLPVSSLLTGSGRENLENDACRARNYLKERAVCLDAVRSRRVQPTEFNRRLSEGLLKSDLLAETTLTIVRSLLTNIINITGSIQMEKIFILCDKFGGRNNYRPLIKTFFPEYQAEPIVESRTVSIYSLCPFSPSSPPVEIRFQMKGEANHPTALASIFSKYLRELSMIFFNSFWQKKIPGLHATAGYPVDARRFYQEIRTKREELNLSDFDIWRNK